MRNDTGVAEGGEIPLYYDPMIAKLVTHAPTRAAAIAAQADALDAFTIDGHPPQHSVPGRADAAQALAGAASSRPASSPRSFPTAFARRRRTARPARVLAAVAAAIDHVLGERKRRISGQVGGRAVTRERRRVVRLGDSEIALDIAREQATRLRGAFRRQHGSKPRHCSCRHWRPGDAAVVGHHRRPADRRCRCGRC